MFTPKLIFKYSQQEVLISHIAETTKHSLTEENRLIKHFHIVDYYLLEEQSTSAYATSMTFKTCQIRAGYDGIYHYSQYTVSRGKQTSEFKTNLVYNLPTHIPIGLERWLGDSVDPDLSHHLHCLLTTICKFSPWGSKLIF